MSGFSLLSLFPAESIAAVETGGAVFSADNRHRLQLTRAWGDVGAPDNPLVVIGLNPSTADADTDDPTIRRVCGFARRDGRTSILMLNLFTLRATEPRVLRALPQADRSLPWADLRDAYLSAFRRAGRLVAAWGVIQPSETLRAQEIAALASEARVPLWCLGRTKARHPRHPLFVAGDTPFEPYDHGGA